MRNKILIVEDDLGLALTLKEFFEVNGLKVFHTADGGLALPIYEKEKPDLILLDIILPRMNGFEIIANIRKFNLSIPIIMMTGTEFNPESQIKGYELGAINYMAKPIFPQAVLALIQHILTLPKNLKLYNIGNYNIYIHSQHIEINKDSFSIREKDAGLLTFLLDRKNQIVSRKSILQQIWLDDNPDNNNNLDGAILRLRRLFKPYRSIQIKTIYGNGYILETDSNV